MIQASKHQRNKSDAHALKIETIYLPNSAGLIRNVYSYYDP